MATTFLAAGRIQDQFFIPQAPGTTPGNGVQLFCYAAGSTTKVTCYKDNAGATPWTNPIVLDSTGNLPSGGEVWVTQGQSMKFVYAPSSDTDPPASPYITLDNYPATNDVTAQTGVEWLTGPTPTFVSATSFTLVGDQTATFTKGRRVKTTNTGGTVYSTIVNSAFGANTTVNIVNDSGALDAGLSAVSYGLFDPANASISPSEIYRKAANVASAGNGTTDIWGTVGDYLHVTGTNTIFFFSTAPYAGAERSLIFDGALTVVHTAPSLLVPGSQNVSTAANDRAIVRADTVSTHTMTFFQQAVGIGLPSWVLIASTAVIVPVATVDFASGIGTKFDVYKLTASNVIPVTDDVLPWIRISEDGGATYKTTAYEYANNVLLSGGTNTASGSTAASSIVIGSNTASTASQGGFSGHVDVYGPSGTAFQKFFIWDTATARTSATQFGRITGAGRYTTDQGAINAIRFMMSSGNVSTGTFALYGLRKG